LYEDNALIANGDNVSMKRSHFFIFTLVTFLSVIGTFFIWWSIWYSSTSIGLHYIDNFAPPMIDLFPKINIPFDECISNVTASAWW